MTQRNPGSSPEPGRQRPPRPQEPQQPGQQRQDGPAGGAQHGTMNHPGGPDQSGSMGSTRRDDTRR